MSFKLVAEVFDLKVGNPLRKMVLIKLADQANDKGECWPSYESIANSCEISRRSVINHIKWLEDNSFLRIERRYNKESAKNYSNMYHLTLDKAKNIDTKKKKNSKSKASEGSAGVALGSAGVALGGSAGVALGSAGAAPKPIKEPISLEPIKEPANDFSGDLTNDDFELSATDNQSEREQLVKSLFDKWLELSGQKIKPSPKRLSHINARLDEGFTVEQIITAMEFVATDKWHIENGQNKIEIAVRSTEQIEKKLIAANKPKPKSKLAVNQNWEQGKKQSRKLQSTVTFEEMFGESL